MIPRLRFPFPHCSMAEVLEREDLIRRRDSGTIKSNDRIRLKVLMRYAVEPQYGTPGDAA